MRIMINHRHFKADTIRHPSFDRPVCCHHLDSCHDHRHHTGYRATGHLGANLVRRLLADGEQVRVMMRAERDNGALDGLDVERVYADLRNSEEVSAAVDGCARVYHCAALVSTIEGNAAHKREIFDTNVRGTINILQAAERHGIDKVVVSGSLSATGYEPDISSHEGMPFYPFDRHLPYGFTKHLTEHECLKAHANGLNVVVATSCAIIGPHDYVPSRMGRVLIDFAHGALRAIFPEASSLCPAVILPKAMC